MARLQPYFPTSLGRARVDDRRVLSGIIFVNRNGLRWRDAPREYGPAKTLYNRWKRWSDQGIKNGRASCGGRVCQSVWNSVVAGSLKRKQKKISPRNKKH